MARSGAPSKLTAGRRQTILDALQEGCSRTTAADAAGINPNTLTAWIGSPPEWNGSNEEFSRECREAIGFAKRRATRVITKAMIDNKDVNTAFRYLAMFERENWAQKNESSVTHTVNVNNVTADDLTDDEIESLASVAERFMADVDR